MKHKFLSILGVFCLLGTSQVWGYNASNAHIYYDNTKSQWCDSYVSTIIGTTSNASVYTMTKIANTNLYVKTDLSWNNYSKIAFMGTSSEWGNQDSYEKRKYAENYSNTWGADFNNYCLFVSSGTSKDAELSYYTNSSITSLLNKSVTIQIMLSVDGGATYNTTDTYYGDIEASRYTFSSEHKTSVSQSKKNFPATTNYVTSALSAIVSFTESNTTTDYVFKGWGKTANAIDATDASWSYLCTGDATVYVYFMKDTKNLIVSAEEGKGSTTGTVTNIVTFAEYYEIQAFEGTGYKFKEWNVTNGSVGYVDGYSATSNPTRIIINDNVAIQATFTAPLTIYFVPSAEDAATDSYHYNVNLKYTSSEDKWKTGNMTIVEDALYHCRPIYKFETEFTSKDYTIGYIQFQTYDGTTFQHQTEIKSITTIAGWQGKMATAGGNVSDYATEACYDLTVASEDDAKGGVNKTSITTYPNNKTEITATPQYGYLFDKWVGSDGVSFDDETKATTNVSATKAGSVTAKFTEQLEVPVYINGTFNNWGNDGTPHKFIRATCTDHIAYFTKTLSADTYTFKIVNAFSQDSKWLSNHGTINSGTVFANDPNNWWEMKELYDDEKTVVPACTLVVELSGNYTFAVNLDNMRISVSYPIELMVSSAGYASYFDNHNLMIPEGLTVQYMTEASEESITWETLSDIIPKTTGVILSGAPGTYTAYTTTDAGTAAEGNLLLGTVEQTEIAENGKPHYVLSNGEFGVGMYFPNFATVDDKTGIGAFTNGAHKAYLELNPASGVTPRRIPFSPRQTPTEVVNVSENENINSKMLINNQLIIIREGKQYNAQGQIIK